MLLRARLKVGNLKENPDIVKLELGKIVRALSGEGIDKRPKEIRVFRFGVGGFIRGIY